jgi:hypothetical protein
VAGRTAVVTERSSWPCRCSGGRPRLKRYPELNDSSARRVAPAGIHQCDLARQGGLIAPAIRDVDGKGLDELMRAPTDLVAGRVASWSQTSDATATVTTSASGASMSCRA